jgi:hypothetical protein
MDLSSPQLLRAELSRIVGQIAQGSSLELDGSAIDELMEPAEAWGYPRLTEVNETRLVKALEAVMLQVPQTFPPSPINDQKIRFALTRSECHYLWFC